MKPQALYFDEGSPLQTVCALLEARLKTYEINGQDAMSPHDIKHGFTPYQIIFLLKDKINQIKGELMEQENQTIQGGESKNGAALLFEQTSEIRGAIEALKSEQKETRKLYKKAIGNLERALNQIYMDYDDKQMSLFATEPTLPEEVQQLINTPSVFNQAL